MWTLIRWLPSSLVWVYIVCPDLPVQKLRIITVFLLICFQPAYVKSEYRKFPKFLDTGKIKIHTKRLNHSVMHPNGEVRMANSVDPDQSSSRNSLIWVCWGAVWSGSALFAQTYPSKNLWSLQYHVCNLLLGFSSSQAGMNDPLVWSFRIPYCCERQETAPQTAMSCLLGHFAISNKIKVKVKTLLRFARNELKYYRWHEEDCFDLDFQVP